MKGKPIEGAKREHVEGVLSDVMEERDRQNIKWDEQNHDQFKWNAILVEEVGEVSKAICDNWYETNMEGFTHLREELIQVAAVAVAFVESLDRNVFGVKTEPIDTQAVKG